MEFLSIGIVSALNLIIIVTKFRLNRVEDGIFDTVLFAFLAILFSGSYGGMVVAMIGSFIVSLYLLIWPPKFFRNIMSNKQVKDTVDKVATNSDNSGVKAFFYTIIAGVGIFAVMAAGLVLTPILAAATILVPIYFIIKLMNTEVDDDEES